MPRFIVFSDVHLHNWKNVGLEYQLDVLNSIISYANQNSIKNLLFCGDMFHTHGRINSFAIHQYNQFLKNIYVNGLNLIGISGNHDHYSKDGSITPLSSMDFVGTFLDRKIIPIEVDGIPIFGHTYSDDESIVQLRLKDSIPKDCILLMHQGVSGVEINSKGFTLNEALHPEMIPDNVLHCFSGHYHTHKIISDKLTIPGALLQHGWSDVSDHRGFLDVFIDSKGVHIKKVNNYRAEFEIVSYDECNESKYFTSLNLRVVDIPSEKRAKELQDRIVFSSRTEFVYKSTAPTTPEIIKSENFSTVDFFEEYVKSRSLSEEQIKIGKELIYGKA